MQLLSLITLILASSSLSAGRTLHHYKRQTVSTGSCGSPGIEFANGLDGRTQPAFEPIDLTSFNHGSALNIGVIIDFITSQLNSPCDAPSATFEIVAQASAAAVAAPSGGAQADAWNKAFGIITDFAAVGETSSSSAVEAAAATSEAASSNSCKAKRKS